MPYIALILAHTIWGIHFVVSKITLQEFPEFSLAFLRFAFASLFLAPFFLAQTKKVKIKNADLPKLVLVGVFIITLNIAFFFSGMKRTDATSASVITLVIPILSVVLGWWFLKEKVFLINLLGIIVGLIGALIIIGIPEILLGEYDTTKLLGNFLIFLASVSFVIGAIFSRQMLKKYPSLIVTAFAFLVGLITFFPLAALEYIQNPGWVDKVTMLGIFGLAFMVLLSSISAYFLFEWGLAKTSLVRADLFQYIEPIWASSLAVLILGEQITIPYIAGAILIAAGVYMGTLAKEPHHRHHKTHRI
ncbi:MAG: DMT family transporter [Patescibacteria group bacterium]